MKYSKLTYYLLTILCIILSSCVTDGIMEECPDTNTSPKLVKDARINFSLTFPSNNATRAIDNGTVNERTIDNVHVYTFQQDKFIEEIEYVVIDGKDGDISRNIDGILKETYTDKAPMEFVVIVNAENKGVNTTSINKGDSKATLYKNLIFNFDNKKDWSKNIPMWGVGKIDNLKVGDNNFGSLDLIRAVSKVNVTVDGGQGIKDFEITEIQLHKYNTQGYCAPLAENSPSIPTDSKISSEYLTSGTLNGTAGNSFENKFYIPEHKNVGVENSKQLELIIKAKVKGQNKDYTIEFKDDNGNIFDVYRNVTYVFNITSVDMDIDTEAILTYNVEKWEEVSINVPDFGK